jgi:adenosine deaminase
VTASYESHKTLADFLSAFHVFLPLIRGDNEAIEQFAYEFCEDQANEKIAYFEVRYSPQLLADIDPKSSSSLASGEAVVKSVNEGLRRGCHAFGVKGRTILCCLGGHPEWSMGVVDLACKFRHEGVVGIDLAGHEILDPPSQEHINAFKRAKELGILRTVHAGESGGPENVVTAVEVLHANRIGHGYHIVDDEAIYEKMKKLGMHFEVCPSTSLMTRSQLSPEHHAVRRFDADRVSYSMNTDDPGVAQITMSHEHLLAINQLGLDSSSLTRCAFNAARSSFLPEDEKLELIEYLKTVHDVPTSSRVYSLSKLFP